MGARSPYNQNCTGATAITLTRTLTPAADTTITIDAGAGGRSVTISGGATANYFGNVQLFTVNGGGALTLRSLTLE